MAEEIKIIIGADVQQGINNVGKFTGKLEDLDDTVSNILGSSKDLDDALDKLGKQGLLSINVLNTVIKGFAEGMKEATDPEDIKKFGDAISTLQKKQLDLVSGGASIEKQHGSQTVATQRLSASVLGLSKIFDILPPELAHATHGFDQLIQSFENISHGTEGTSEKISKFASVLGQVGLGLAISVAVGLITTLVSELLNADEALDIASEHGREFADTISSIDKSIDQAKHNLEFIGQLRDLKIDINVGKGFEGDVIKATGALGDLQKEAASLDEDLERINEISGESFKDFAENASDALKGVATAANAFKQLNSISKKELGEATEADKEFIKNIEENQKERDKVNKLITENQDKQVLLRNKLQLIEVEEGRKVNKELNALLESRANIIKEFTAKFASIKDPFPDFFTKNLPLGKVEDKALRAALENAFKVLETASRDLFNTKKIDPGTIPIEIKFKPEIIGKTDLVRQIEDSFGEISKEVQSAINKGIFIVPAEFKIAPEGNGQALQEFETLRDDFLRSIESLTGQRRAILDISADFLVSLTPEKARNTLEKLQDQIQAAASGIPLKVVMKGTADVQLVVDKDKLAIDLAHDINEAIVSFAENSFEGFGEALGDALSNGINKDGLKKIIGSITDFLGTVGKALIKAGVAALGIQKVIDKLALNPALAIGLGVALVALSKALSNNIQNAREKGGPVQPGISYLVNEKGREIFQPSSGAPYWIEGGPQMFKPKTSGKIIPAPLTASFAKMFADKFNIAAFENGGLVTGPVFGLLGEGSSISSINPEVIAPLETLKNLLPDFKGQAVDVRVSGSIRNRVIALGQNREARSNRRTG